jgi:WD40 repeat protein
LGMTAAALGEPATRPATRPATQPVADVLPPGAVRRLGGHQFPTDGLPYGRVAVAPDGRRAAVADNGGASIWDVATGDRVAVVRPDARPGRLPFGVTYLSANTLAVACADVAIAPRTSAVSLFLADPTTGRIRGKVDLADGTVPVATRGDRNLGVLVGTMPTGLVASPDGREVGFRVGRQTLLVYEVATGRQVPVPSPVAEDGPWPSRPARLRNSGFALSVSLGGGGRGVIVNGAGQATVFDVQTGGAVGGRTFPAAHGASVSADGRLLATITGGAVHLFSLPDGAERDVMPGPPVETNERPTHVAFAPTGSLLAVNMYGQLARVEVLDVAARPARVVAELPLRRPLEFDSVWSADGRVVVARPSSFGIVAFDARTGRSLSPPSTAADHPTALAADPDGHSVVIGDTAGHLHRWDLDTGRLLADFDDNGGAVGAPAQPFVGPVSDLRYVSDADGAVALAVTRQREQWLADRQTLAVRIQLGGPMPTTGLPDIYSPDGRRVAHFDNAGVVVADARTDRTLVAPPDDERSGPSDSWMGHIRFSDDGQLLVTSTSRGFRVLDARRGRAGPVVAVRGVNALSLSPDGRFLAIGVNQEVDLYSTATTDAGPLWTVPAPTTTWGPVFDASARWLAVPSPTADVLSNGANLTAYETASGRLIVTLPTPGLDSKVRFVPRRPLYVTTERDGTALVRSLRGPLGSAELGRSDDQLWADVAGDDPAVAYRAGFALDDRGQLVVRARSLAPGSDWPVLISELSSPDRATREAAHKRLEDAGPAAGDAIRRALATHPGGETEARLADLARLAGDPTAAPVAAASATDESLRRDRVIQLLDWSADAAAPAELARLGGGPATTRP